MLTTYQYHDYFVHILPETSNDIACYWRTYRISNRTTVREFHLENEYKENNAECIRRIHEVIKTMDKLNMKNKNNLYTRYKNEQGEYCIHGRAMNYRCYDCEEIRKHEIEEMNKKEQKMTREEAVKEISSTVFGYSTPNFSDTPSNWIKAFEALGLLKFDEPKKPIERVNIHRFAHSYGGVAIEEWPEGLVLWVGGEIVWKSWEKYYKKGDAVTIEYYVQGYTPKGSQAGTIK